MNPSVNDRLNSVLRALETVVLPALPERASLAREQVMLSIGHIQIIQAQMDATPAFEHEEMDDIRAMGRAILEAADAPSACANEAARLKEALDQTHSTPRETTDAIREQIDDLLIAARQSSEVAYHEALSRIILPLGRERARKDREWFAVMGFDIELSGG